MPTGWNYWKGTEIGSFRTRPKQVFIFYLQSFRAWVSRVNVQRKKRLLRMFECLMVLFLGFIYVCDHQKDMPSRAVLRVNSFLFEQFKNQFKE